MLSFGRCWLLSVTARGDDVIRAPCSSSSFVSFKSQFVSSTLTAFPARGGGGGTSILKVSGTCRWQGYDFAIIAIKTGCLNQPNHWHRVSKSAYLAPGTDYSVYHRVAFPPTMFMTGPRSRHRCDASVRAGPVFQRSLIIFFMNGS